MDGNKMKNKIELLNELTLLYKNLEDQKAVPCLSTCVISPYRLELYVLKKDYTLEQIKDLNKIKPGQDIKIPTPKVKDRKSVYQGMSKSEMKKIAMPKKKYGGKVVKRKEGGQVMSGNDLVSSLYN